MIWAWSSVAWHGVGMGRCESETVWAWDGVMIREYEHGMAWAWHGVSFPWALWIPSVFPKICLLVNYTQSKSLLGHNCLIT